MDTMVRIDDAMVPLTYETFGTGPTVLLLHGGGGPMTVRGWGESYAAEHHARVLVPVHPGFGGTPRPDFLDDIRDLARLYARLLADLELTDVTVIGNSIGGWITAELAVLNSPNVGRTVLVDAVGLRLDNAPIADFFSLTMDQVVDLSYYTPARFRMGVDALPDAAKAAMAGNREALRVYGGTTMNDATLLGRLPAARQPSLVIWGAADRIVPPEHGHAYAAAMPAARFELIEDAGHLPQLETPDTLNRLVADFMSD